MSFEKNIPAKALGSAFLRPFSSPCISICCYSLVKNRTLGKMPFGKKLAIINSKCNYSRVNGTDSFFKTNFRVKHKSE